MSCWLSREFRLVKICRDFLYHITKDGGVCAGRLLHSHNYRENSNFKGQRVVVMGASASGQDISRDIAQVADKVRPINVDERK